MPTQKVSWGIGMSLLEGPLTIEELKEGIENSPFVSSLQPGPSRRGLRHRRSVERLSQDLAELIRAGWVVEQGDRFALTELGRAEMDRVA
jgi:hypothetical protein